MLILLKHGLCNRLRTIVGFWYIAENRRTPITAHWSLDDPECNGRFTDLFEPIESEFFKLEEVLPQPKQYNFVGQNTIKNIIRAHCNPTITDEMLELIEIEFYGKLLPLPEIILPVQEFVKSNGTYSAVHIRRTDHCALAKRKDRYTEDVEFDNFIQDSISKGNKVYIATDDPEIQKRYAIPECLFYRQIEPDSGTRAPLRKTTLEHAFIDILIASKSQEFMGSGYSSYSDCIEIFRKMNFANK